MRTNAGLASSGSPSMAATEAVYFFPASSLGAFVIRSAIGRALQRSLLVFPFHNPKLQFLPALHAASFFKERHAAHFSGGVGFLPCAIVRK